MYYNQISKIKEETKGKDNEQKKEAIDIYAFSKVRSNKVAERKKQQITMYKDLEGKGRVSTTFERVRSATGNAIGSAALKLVTFGLAKTKKHQDEVFSMSLIWLNGLTGKNLSELIVGIEIQQIEHGYVEMGCLVFFRLVML